MDEIPPPGYYTPIYQEPRKHYVKENDNHEGMHTPSTFAQYLAIIEACGCLAFSILIIIGIFYLIVYESQH